MKIHYLLVFVFLSACFGLKAQYPALNFTLISNLDPETGFNSDGDKYSGCWGWYQASKNKEYAIAGSQSGTYWVDISNPATPTVSAYRAGQVSGATWREIKTYQNYCYVISDDNGPNSLQIFDMQYLPDSVSKVFDSQSLFKRGHAQWIDGNKWYVSSVTYSNNGYSSMNVYSLANPAQPVLLRQLDQDYSFISTVHDMMARNDTVFASCAWQGLYVFKFNANNTFTQLGSLTSYPSAGYNHSSALTPDGQTLVFMDEVPNGLPIKTANVSNLANIQVLATTNQFSQTTPHNPFMLNNQYCLASSYQEGVQLYDISNPSAPILAGYFDTYPQGGGNTGNWGFNAYNGQWGAYPWFPSKTIFGLDMLNGVFLLKTSLYQNSLNSTVAVSAPAVNCVGRPVNIGLSSPAANSFTLSTPGALTALSYTNNVSVTYTSVGIYTITAQASNGLSVTPVTTITISVTGNPTAAVTTSNASCAACNNGTLWANPSGGTSPYTYTWIPSGGNYSVALNRSPGCYTVHITDANTCTTTASGCVNFNVDTGLDQALASGDNARIYPNPATTQLTVGNSGRYVYSLYNQLGQLVVQGNGSERNTISLETIPAGIYLLQLETGHETIHKKIIIER